LATLKDGDAFGEEALLSEAKRNATITMDSDGVLMRLSKDDFNALLKEPMLSWLDLAEAQELVAGGAKWLDVRLESEHANTGLKDSENIPLFMLRLKVDTLDPDAPYIVYCDTGRRSSAAAFLLSERGFQACCLKGGVMEQAPPEGA
jgi:rhodanese-related sulfurtransferase